MEIGELVRRAGQHFGQRTAFVCEGTEMTFAELDLAADRVGHHLQWFDLSPGASIAAMLSNPRHKSHGLEMKAEFTEVEAVLTSESQLDGVDVNEIGEIGSRPAIDRDRPCQVDRRSATTLSLAAGNLPLGIVPCLLRQQTARLASLGDEPGFFD